MQAQPIMHTLIPSTDEIFETFGQNELQFQYKVPKIKPKHHHSVEREPLTIELEPDLITNKMPLSLKPSPKELKYLIDPKAVRIPHLSHIPSHLPSN